MTSELDPAAIEIGSFFAQPPGVAWRALTEPGLLELWLMRSVGFSPTVGTHFIFCGALHAVGGDRV